MNNRITKYSIFDEKSQVRETLQDYSFEGTRGVLAAHGTYTIQGGEILTFGDLHLSAIFKGTHKNYMLNCLKVMGRILEIVRTRKHVVSGVFFLGDILGVKEQKIVDHEFLEKVFQFFEALNNLVDGNVYAVQGNHDISEFPDFQWLVARGLLKAPEYVDHTDKNGEIHTRYHFVGYGDEQEELSTVKGTGNIVLCHNDIQVEDQTEWYGGDGALEVSKMGVWNEVDLVLPGHIHNPSTEMMTTRSPNNSIINVFYIGCPTRVSQRYEDCFFFTFWYNGTDNEAEAVPFGLWSVEEEFHPKVDELDIPEDDTLEEERTVRLREFVEEIIVSRINVVNPLEQLRTIPEATEEAIVMASRYLQEAQNSN